MLGEFPKDIGDVVLCMRGFPENAIIGNRYIVIHSPHTKFKGSSGLYWLMEEGDLERSNFLKGDVPLLPVERQYLENPDVFTWVGAVEKIVGKLESRTDNRSRMYES